MWRAHVLQSRFCNFLSLAGITVNLLQIQFYCWLILLTANMLHFMKYQLPFFALCYKQHTSVLFYCVHELSSYIA